MLIDLTIYYTVHLYLPNSIKLDFVIFQGVIPKSLLILVIIFNYSGTLYNPFYNHYLFPPELINFYDR